MKCSSQFSTEAPLRRKRKVYFTFTHAIQGEGLLVPVVVLGLGGWGGGGRRDGGVWLL